MYVPPPCTATIYRHHVLLTTCLPLLCTYYVQAVDILVDYSGTLGAGVTAVMGMGDLDAPVS